MIVEDDKYILKAMDYKFTQAGFDIKVSTSAEEAFQLLKAWKPEVIILDILLPGVDGYEFLRTIKDDPRLKDIPVIISSNLDEDVGSDPLAKEYIVKSDLDLDELVKKVSKLVK